jgi:hypothetical protein
MEQAIGASLEAAVEISAEHAASSASTPEEAERLRQGVYQACEKGFAVAAVFGIGKGIRSVKAGAGAAKMGSVKPHHTRDDVYIPQSKTGSSFSQFDAKASRITKKAHEAEDVGLTLTHNVGSRQAFDRKLTALQDLAERGKLVKVSNVVRDESVTIAYRKRIITQAQTQWGATDPARVQRIEHALKTRLHADHLHELQLGGMDHVSALSLLDKQVNMSVGSQIMHQLKDVPVGTRIASVVEKGSKK